MLCKDCKVEMEKGILISNGQIWTTQLNPLTKIFGGIFPKVMRRVQAWNCPNCKKIELYTEDTK